MEERLEVEGGGEGALDADHCHSIKAPALRSSFVRLLAAVYVVGTTPCSCSDSVVLGPR